MNVEFSTNISDEYDSDSLSSVFNKLDQHFYVKSADTVW